MIFPEFPRHPEACYLPYRPTFLKTTPLGRSADRNVDIPNLMQTAQVETASDYTWMGWSVRQTRQLFLKDHVSMFTSEQDCRSTGKKVGEQKEWILSMQPTVKKCLHVVSLRHLRTNGNLWMIHCRFVKKNRATNGVRTVAGADTTKHISDELLQCPWKIGDHHHHHPIRVKKIIESIKRFMNQYQPVPVIHVISMVYVSYRESLCCPPFNFHQDRPSLSRPHAPAGHGWTSYGWMGHESSRHQIWSDDIWRWSE